MIQSNDEIIRVADEWVRNFCPQDVVIDGKPGEKNATLIMERCLQAGIVSISGLTKAERDLRAAGKLVLIPQLTRAQKQAELTKRLLAKQHEKDIQKKLENSPAAIAARNAVAAKEQAEKNAAAKLASLKSEIIREVNSYRASSQTGFPNYSADQSGRSTLIDVLKGFGKVSFDKETMLVNAVDIAKVDVAERALTAVKTAKGRL